MRDLEMFYSQYMRMMSAHSLVRRIYAGMQTRTTSPKHNKAHIYLGKECCSREEFTQFSLKSPVFHDLFDKWIAADKPKKLTPSIDRIDGTKGYLLGNMRWITFSENCKHVDYKKRKNKRSSSKYVGVDRAGKQWRSRIRINYKEILIGYFDDEVKAHQAYQDYQNKRRDLQRREHENRQT